MAKSGVGVPIDGQLKDQIAWYETGLSLMERKKRGHFSTPPMLVGQILDACGYISGNDLSRVRVLDPACGSGNFLAGAAQRLLAFGTRTGLTLEESTALVQRNLWGFDPDPVCCFLAEMQLRTIINASVLLHIHQADSLALPWEPCVDLFVANPPYLAAKNNDLSGYRFAQQRGQADSYLLFLSLALQVVRPGGWIGLVLPDPLLARANASMERTCLLEETTLHHLWHLSGVFAADVGAVIIIAQKCPPEPVHQVSWVRERWQSTSFDSQQQILLANPEGDRKGPHPSPHHPRPYKDTEELRQQYIQQVQQDLFSRQPGAEFRYLLNQGRGPTLEQLQRCLAEPPQNNRRFVPLGEFVSISRGEEIGRESPLIQNIACDLSAYYPLLRGGIDIHPYSPPRTGWQIAREAIRKPLERYLAPKLLVVKSTDRLQAALDLKGQIALQTLYLLHLRDERQGLDQLYFFLALLNSRLLREYVFVMHTAYKWVQPQIEQHVLACLPVPIVEAEHQQQIIEQAKALAHACSSSGPVVEWDEHITGMYEEQERAICALYDSVLPGLLTDKGVMRYG
jgi:SAM-dependent methyltransferase